MAYSIMFEAFLFVYFGNRTWGGGISCGNMKLKNTKTIKNFIMCKIKVLLILSNTIFLVSLDYCALNSTGLVGAKSEDCLDLSSLDCL